MVPAPALVRFCNRGMWDGYTGFAGGDCLGDGLSSVGAATGDRSAASTKFQSSLSKIRGHRTRRTRGYIHFRRRELTSWSVARKPKPKREHTRSSLFVWTGAGLAGALVEAAAEDG